MLKLLKQNEGMQDSFKFGVNHIFIFSFDSDENWDKIKLYTFMFGYFATVLYV